MWLAAFFLLLIGGMISGAIYLFREANLQWWTHFCLSIFITSLVVGITLICASSQWWLRR